MTKVTWKGEPGGPAQIEQYGHIFPRGKAVEVPADHPQMAKFKGNRFFVVEAGEPVKGAETAPPETPEPEPEPEDESAELTDEESQ